MAQAQFAQRLSIALRAKGWTQKELARRGFAQSSISKWKKELPTAASLRRLEAALGLPLGAFDAEPPQWEAVVKTLNPPAGASISPGPPETPTQVKPELLRRIAELLAEGKAAMPLAELLEWIARLDHDEGR